MSLTLLPNTAALTSQFLRTQAEVTALVGQHVYTILPNTKTYPLVRVTRIGGSPANRGAYWVDRPLFQVDCWATTAEQAHNVAETVRAVLAQRFTGLHTFTGVAGVVSRIEPGGIREGFDPDDKTKALASFDVAITVHP